MNRKFYITVCASGGGGNLQTLIDNQSLFGYKINLVIVDRECGAIRRARDNKINIYFFNINAPNAFRLMDKAIPENTNLIVLAGFMPILSPEFCAKWDRKIINTHPSLLPQYGGKGMYGVKVQEAVMAANEEYAGCTIHYVNKDIDRGEIILQKRIKVDYKDTPWELGGKIFIEEGVLLLEAIKGIMCKRKD